MELLTFPEHLSSFQVSSTACVAQYLVSCEVFCGLLVFVFSFLFWLWICLSCFDLRFLVIPLIAFVPSQRSLLKVVCSMAFSSQSSHVTYYCPRSDFAYYNLTAHTAPLHRQCSSNTYMLGCIGELCGSSPANRQFSAVLYRYEVYNGLVWFLVFNATVNNFLVISWGSVLLMGETRVSGENQRLVASN